MQVVTIGGNPATTQTGTGPAVTIEAGEKLAPVVKAETDATPATHDRRIIALLATIAATNVIMILLLVLVAVQL